MIHTLVQMRRKVDAISKLGGIENEEKELLACMKKLEVRMKHVEARRKAASARLDAVVQKINKLQSDRADRKVATTVISNLRHHVRRHVRVHA